MRARFEDPKRGGSKKAATGNARAVQELPQRASQHLALDCESRREGQFDLGVEEVVLARTGGARAENQRGALHQAAIVCGEGVTWITVALVIRTIRPCSAPVMSR